MGLESGSLWKYEGLDFLEFNGKTTLQWGYVEMIILVGGGKDVRIVSLKFLFLPCISV